MTLADQERLPIAPAREATRQDELERWRATRSRILQSGNRHATELQRSRGKLAARERVEQLLDPGSFQELHMLRYTADVSLLEGKQAHGDGIVAGWGTIESRRTFVYSQDPTVVGGSLGEVGGAKVHRVIDLATEAGAPIVGISDGGGARIQEAVASLCAYGGIFLRNTRASGIIPQVSLIMGTATGGAVYSPALTDFVFMVEGTATMAITGPKVVREVTREDVSLDELGGPSVHAQHSGVAHFVVPDERACFTAARRLLGFLPASNREAPPAATPQPPLMVNGRDPSDALSTTLDAPYDTRLVTAALIDASDLFEYAQRWAPNVVCGLARLGGRTTGVVANQPDVSAGRLDIDGCDKAARFIRTCDTFNVPVVTIVDCPGFVPGARQEHGGIVRSAAKLIHAYAEATVPKVHLVVGRAYGDAIVALGATRAVSSLCLAWPTANITAAPPRPYARASGPSPGHATAGTNMTAGPYEAAMTGVVDQVIEPRDSRAVLIESLAMLSTIERGPVPRKHENLPL